MPDRDYAIETQDLTKYFKRTKTEALSRVNIKIGRKQIVALLGQNGAGKTTLLKILATLILPTSGCAYVNGYNIAHDENNVKRSIGLITGDERGFYWRLTARQNMEFFSALYNISQRQTKDRIEELFKLFDIDNPNKRFQEYSSGLKQRFGIIRGLLHNPDILLMDEPTKSLDPVSSKNLREFIKETLVRELGKTILFTTHRLEEIKDFCDSIIILDRGRVISSGALTQEEVFRCLQDRRVHS